MITDLESVEHSAYADVLRASPELGEVAEIGGALCFVIRSMPERAFNRVVGLTSPEPLDEIAAFYAETPWWVSDSHGLGAELEERGFTRDYGWMKFSRGVSPRQARSDLHVELVGTDRAADFAAVVAGGFDMPESLVPIPANIVGRPGWSCYVAYQDATPAGAGALFVHPTGDLNTGRGRLGPATLPAKIGWLGFGATLPEFRGRGAQSAVLATRIEDARQQGCSTVITETGELQEGRPSSSYRNILRAGFREAGVRPNYRAP